MIGVWSEGVFRLTVWSGTSFPDQNDLKDEVFFVNFVYICRSVRNMQWYWNPPNLSPTKRQVSDTDTHVRSRTKVDCLSSYEDRITRMCTSMRKRSVCKRPFLFCNWRPCSPAEGLSHEALLLISNMHCSSPLAQDTKQSLELFPLQLRCCAW